MRRLIPWFAPVRARTKAARRAPGRRRPARWLRLSRRTGVMGLVLVLLVGGPLYAWRTGQVERAVGHLQATATSVSADAGYTIQDVLSVGRQETTREAVLAALGVTRGQPIMDFDPQAAKRRLEAIGWIQMATVQRQLPDTIRVHLVERRPFARWQHGGQTVLVDRDGEVIGTEGLDRYAELPLIVGDAAAIHAPALFALLITEPDLNARVMAAVHVGSRRWNLLFDNGIEVRMPEADPAAAWARFARLVREHGLLERAVSVVDLRLADRLTLRLDDGAVGDVVDLGPRI